MRLISLVTHNPRPFHEPVGHGDVRSTLWACPACGWAYYRGEASSREPGGSCPRCCDERGKLSFAVRAEGPFKEV